jgi:hypothetical protein
MITIRFQFLKKEVPGGHSYMLVDYKPFPANVLPALLMFVCQEIVKLPLPEDNPYKRIAQTALEGVLAASAVSSAPETEAETPQ